MLVVTRKPSQSIIISDSIKVTVLEVNGRSIRLGIEAPKEVPVHREEIHQRLHAPRAEKQSAA